MWDLVPSSGFKSAPPAWSLSHWTTKEAPGYCSYPCPLLLPTSTYFPPLISQWYTLVLGEVKNKMSSLWAFWLGLHQSACNKGIFLGGGVWSISHVWLFVTPWTVAHQAPLSMGFPAKNTGMGCYFLLQGIFPTQGSNSLFSALAGRFFTPEPPGTPHL